MNARTRRGRAILRDRRCTDRRRALRNAAWSSPFTRSVFNDVFGRLELRDSVTPDFRVGGYPDFLYRQYAPVPPRPVFTDQEWAEGTP
jgi:hypothetical protein